ncbi:MAG: hypothetical protein LBK23_08135 [Oscillospiraceae bacterium]|jgi:hypothetical protein|nr:hypothetical protein [Oscillospiraceae bacterium]
MTPNEIIAGLEDLAEDRKSFFDCDDIVSQQFHDDYNVLMEAISAIKHHEPMPIETLYTGVFNIDLNKFIQIGRCPKCDKLIQDFMRHCAECGQALLWPEATDGRT